MATDPRDVLLDLLVERGYVFDPAGRIQLSSGKLSDEYIDCRAALSFAEALSAAAEVMYPRLRREVEAVGGLTMGADPLAISLALHSRNRPHRVRWFSVRKEPKGHGLKKLIEGSLPPHSRLAVLEDVVTEGRSTMDAIDRCQQAGHVIVQVLVLIDREQGGMDKIRNAVPRVPVEAIFRKGELRERWRVRHSSR